MADNKQLIIEFTGNDHDRVQLFNIFKCVDFWNKEGPYCHTHYNENYRKGEAYENFILRMINADCKVNIGVSKGLMGVDTTGYITGRGSNHVWIHRISDMERIVFIHF